jgi:hypothetical protein
MSATEVAAHSGSTAVSPFEVHFSDEELSDLRRRIDATRWPDAMTASSPRAATGARPSRRRWASRRRRSWSASTPTCPAPRRPRSRKRSCAATRRPRASRPTSDAPTTSWAEQAYPDNLIYYNRLDRGGHFAAWEQPQLFSEEMRKRSTGPRKIVICRDEEGERRDSNPRPPGPQPTQTVRLRRIRSSRAIRAALSVPLEREGRISTRAELARRAWGSELASGDRRVDHVHVHRCGASCSARHPGGRSSTPTTAWAIASRPSPQRR